MEEKKRKEALLEIEEVKKSRNSTMIEAHDVIKKEVMKVILAKKKYMKPPL